MKKILTVLMCLLLVVSITACGHKPVVDIEPTVPPTTEGPTVPPTTEPPLIPNYEIEDKFTVLEDETLSDIQGEIDGFQDLGALLIKVDGVWMNDGRAWDIDGYKSIISFDGQFMVTEGKDGMVTAHGYDADEVVSVDLECTKDQLGKIFSTPNSANFIRAYNQYGNFRVQLYNVIDGVEMSGPMFCRMEDESLVAVAEILNVNENGMLMLVDGQLVMASNELEDCDEGVAAAYQNTVTAKAMFKYYGSSNNFHCFAVDTADDTYVRVIRNDGAVIDITLPEDHVVSDISEIYVNDDSVYVVFVGGPYGIRYICRGLAEADKDAELKFVNAISDIQSFEQWIKDEKVKNIVVVDGDTLVLMDDGIIYKVN
jgi:hypothetical protein